MLTFHKLRIFTVVVEQGSLNRAAGALFMAQSAVSGHMHDLERALGVALLERSARGVRPTAAGDVLYRYAQQITALLSEAEREILRAAGAQDLEMAVSATPGISVYLLPSWLQRLHAAYPQVRVSLQTALTAELVRETLGGRYDLGFLEGELDELDQPSLGRIQIATLDYAIVVNGGHRWAAGAREPVVPAAWLADEPFITRQPGSRTRRWADALLAEAGVRPRPVAELDSPGAIKYALLNPPPGSTPTGAAILPRYAVEREAERRELALCTLEGVPLSRALLMVWDKRGTFTPVERAFIALLAENAPALHMLLS
jgi:DNA-binding transcriptional LysR family regulator